MSPIFHQVDIVKINSLKDFGPPESLAKKVEAVEMGKEGVTLVDMVSAKTTRPACEDVPAYEIEYIVDSSRGKNHYLVKTTVVDKSLYVFTVQGPDASFPALATTATEMMNSLHIERQIKNDVVMK